MTITVKANFVLLLPLLFLAGNASAQTIYDMGSASQFSGNFYTTYIAAGSTLSAPSGQLLDTTTTSGTAIWVYDPSPDTTPSASFDTFTTSMNVKVGGSNSAVGFYFDDGGDRTNALLALVNINYSSTSDEIRFFSGGNMTTGTAGTVQSTSPLASGGYDLNATYLLTLSVTSLGGGQVSATLTLSDPNNLIAPFSSTYTFSGLAATSGEIGYRSTTAATSVTNTFDNLAIPAAVPEPSAMGLAALGLLLGARAVRRRTARFAR